MKLKTQKEIFEEHLIANPDSRRALEFMDRERKEAIKLLKKGNRELKKKIVIDWHGAFTDFFNVTEKDLNMKKEIKTTKNQKTKWK